MPDFKLTPVEDKKQQSKRKSTKKTAKNPIEHSQTRLENKERGVIARDELGSWLWGAADILRGAVSADDYGDFVLPLLFFKRLSDNYSFEYEQRLEKYGDDRVARDAMFCARASSIAESEIIIADLTKERPNCYYETGFAQALGKELILTIKEGERKHFDLAGHRFIEWETAAELKSKLEVGMEAIMKRRSSIVHSIKR